MCTGMASSTRYNVPLALPRVVHIIMLTFCRLFSMQHDSRHHRQEVHLFVDAYSLSILGFHHGNPVFIYS
jgi:hypothetical protein